MTGMQDAMTTAAAANPDSQVATMCKESVAKAGVKTQLESKALAKKPVAKKVSPKSRAKASAKKAAPKTKRTAKAKAKAPAKKKSAVKKSVAKKVAKKAVDAGSVKGVLVSYGSGGYGFIEADGFDKNIFAHVSAFVGDHKFKNVNGLVGCQVEVVPEPSAKIEGAFQAKEWGAA